MASKNTSENIKKRYWAFLLYPESAPEDWKDKLQATGLPVAVSPLHDNDINPDGTPKKAHYHIILCYNGPTTYTTVKALCDSLNQPRPQALEAVKGYYRYFTHEDNPEKAQYSKGDITHINGFNIMDYMSLSLYEVNVLKRQIQSTIREKNIMEYSTLLDLLMDTQEWEQLDVAQSHTMLFNAYIKSRKYKYLEELKQISVDPDTGEVLE